MSPKIYLNVPVYRMTGLDCKEKIRFPSIFDHGAGIGISSQYWPLRATCESTIRACATALRASTCLACSGRPPWRPLNLVRVLDACVRHRRRTRGCPILFVGKGGGWIHEPETFRRTVRPPPFATRRMGHHLHSPGRGERRKALGGQLWEPIGLQCQSPVRGGTAQFQVSIAPPRLHVQPHTISQDLRPGLKSCVRLRRTNYQTG